MKNYPKARHEAEMAALRAGVERLRAGVEFDQVRAGVEFDQAERRLKRALSAFAAAVDRAREYGLDV